MGIFDSATFTSLDDDDPDDDLDDDLGDALRHLTLYYIASLCPVPNRSRLNLADFSTD